MNIYPKLDSWSETNHTYFLFSKARKRDKYVNRYAHSNSRGKLRRRCSIGKGCLVCLNLTSSRRLSSAPLHAHTCLCSASCQSLRGLHKRISWSYPSVGFTTCLSFCEQSGDTSRTGDPLWERSSKTQEEPILLLSIRVLISVQTYLG